MNCLPSRNFACYIRAKGQTDAQWRDVSAISAWSAGCMDYGVECIRNEGLRRFVSAAARAGDIVEVKVVAKSKEFIREMRVIRYKNRGPNKAPEGYMWFEFYPAIPPKLERFLTVKMITD